MQRHGVDEVLQVVAVLDHGALQGLLPVLFHLRPQVARFVVGDVKPPAVLEDQVDEPAHHPANGVEAQGRPLVPGGAQPGEQGVQPPGLQSRQGVVELQLIEPLAGGDIPQPQPGAIQRRVQDIPHHPLDDRLPLAAVAVAGQLPAHLGGKRLPLRQGKIQALEDGVHEGAGPRPLGEPEDVGATMAGLRLAVFAGAAVVGPFQLEAVGAEPGEARHPPGLVYGAPGRTGGQQAGLGRRGLVAGLGQGRRFGDLQTARGPFGQRLQTLAHGRIVQLAEALRHLLQGVVRRLGMEQPGEGGAVRLLEVAPGKVAEVLGPGQGHVEQAQLLGEPLLLRQGVVFEVGQQVEDQAALVPLFVEQGRQAAFDRLRPPEEGQEHHRVLQPLALVDGDDLHQRLVALQAQLLLLALAVGVGALLGEPVQQVLDAMMFAAGVLDHLGQLQQVGKSSLTAFEAQQAVGDAPVVQQVAEHGHEVGPQPEVVVAVERLHQILPAVFIRHEGVQLARGQPQKPGAEGGAQGPLFVGLGHGEEDAQQLVGLLALQHAVAAVVDAGHAAGAQGLLHLRGLVAVTHQHGDVPRRQRGVLQGCPRLGAEAQQPHDLLGAGEAELLVGPPLVDDLAGPAVGILRLPGNKPRLERGGHLTVHAQGLGIGLACRGHRFEVDVALVDEGGGATAEEDIDPLHQPLGRAPVGTQGEAVVSGVGVALGHHVGEDVGAAEAVNGLLGVADHEQPAAGALAVDGRKDAVLLRVGVLELINEGQREALGDAPGELLPPLPLQGIAEAGQQVVEGDHRQLLLAGGKRLAAGVDGLHRKPQLLHAAQGDGAVAEGEEGVLGGLNSLFLLGRGDGAGQLAGGKEFQVGGQGVVSGRGGEELIHGQSRRLHRLELVGAAAQVLAVVDEGEDGLSLLRPQRGHFGEHRPVDGRFERPLVQLGQDHQLPPRHVGANGPAQPLGGAPAVTRQLRQAGVAVEFPAPEILHHPGEQLALVGDEFGIEQRPALEGVLQQHALAEAVDGENGRLVDGGELVDEALGRLLGVLQPRQQLVQQRVVAGGPLQRRQGLPHTGANAVPQLFSGGLGEGDHQNFAHRTPLFQQQAQVEGGDGVGLAGAGARLDEAHAVAGKLQGLERLHSGFVLDLLFWTIHPWRTEQIRSMRQIHGGWISAARPPYAGSRVPPLTGLIRHAREGGHPVPCSFWAPAFAGATMVPKPALECLNRGRERRKRKYVGWISVSASTRSPEWWMR